MAGGAAGISIGRNAFQHRHPVKFVRAAACIVHQNKSVDEALKVLKGKVAEMIGKEIRIERIMDRNTGRVGHRADGPRVLDGTD